MNILKSQFEDVADIDAGEIPHHNYEGKFNIVMKNAIETIPGKSYLTTAFAILHEAAKTSEVIELYDGNNTPIHHDLQGIVAKEIEKQFSVEVGGKNKKVFMFGLKSQSTLSYTTLKNRVESQLLALTAHQALDHDIIIGEDFIDILCTSNSQLLKLANQLQLTDPWTKTTPRP